jgi:PhnB protein
MSISPWISVCDATQAVEFYKAAFGAHEIERVEGAPGSIVIAQLSIDGATMWVQQDDDVNPRTLGGCSTVRMILSVADPDAVFARALASGAREVAHMHEENGWRVGRIADPTGHHWEIGKPL